jgi:hypothetical protein
MADVRTYSKQFISEFIEAQPIATMPSSGSSLKSFIKFICDCAFLLNSLSLRHFDLERLFAFLFTSKQQEYTGNDNNSSVGHTDSILTTTSSSTDGFNLNEVCAILLAPCGRSAVFRLNCANYTVQVSRCRVANSNV